MPGYSMDPEFPTCCSSCPHLEQFTASCSHDLRQYLLRELDDSETCPVYVREKARAMRRLSDGYRGRPD